MKLTINSAPFVFQTLSHNKSLLMRQCLIIDDIRKRCIEQARISRCNPTMTACNIIDQQYMLLLILIKNHNEFEQQCIEYCNGNNITEDDVDTLNAVLEQLTVRYNDIKQNILIQEKVFS